MREVKSMLEKRFMVSLMLMVSMFLTVSVHADITGPGQPTSGPGGSDYGTFTGITSETRGAGINKYIIYEPTPKSADPLPVIAFLHGYNRFPNPAPLVKFITHLVKKGNIVIWPQYMVWFSLPENFAPNAGNAIRAALDHIIGDSSHTQPATDNGEIKWALIGHSAGGITAANIAATYDDYDLDPPLALTCLAPGRGREPELPIPIEDYGNIPSEIKMLIIIGNQDNAAKDHGKYIWDNAPQIPDDQKDWLLLKTDDHGTLDGSQILVADHYAPLANYTLPEDAFDWYGYWKWSTALCNFAFYGTDEDYALGGTELQRFMGTWSDGVDVTQPEVTDYVNWQLQE